MHRRELFRGFSAASLLALNGRTAAGSRQLSGLRSVASLAELHETSPAVGTVLFDGGVFRWSLGDHSGPPLGPPDDRRVAQHAGTPLSVGAWVRQSGALSPAVFGATPGTGADAMANARAFRDAIAAAGAGGLPLALDGASYVLHAAGGVNFAHEGLHIKGGGGTLQFVGRGRGFVIDQGGSDGAFLESMTIEDLVIVGGPKITDGFYSRGIVRSTFRNIEVRAVSGKAFHLRHAVSNHYDCLKYSPSSSDPVTAIHGLYIDNNGAGFFSANCVFTNAVMEDFPGVGCHLSDATGMLFNGGTFEGCDTGLIVAQPSDDNLFVKLWAEANHTADVIVSGNRNGFTGGKFFSPSSEANVHIRNDANGTWFSGGGYIRSVHIGAEARGTSFVQVGIDENRNGTIGFRGSGSFTRVGCTKVDAKNTVVGRYDDVIGPVAAIGNGGQWAPILRATRGTISTRADLTQGSYQKIGKLVFAQCFVYVESVQGVDGELFVDGLPFVSAARQPGSMHATQLHLPQGGALQARIDPGGRTLFVSHLVGGAAWPCAQHVRADTTLSISVTYLTID